MISVIIPTYKEPHALDICLMSAIKGQKDKNQIIVVVDGYYDVNKEVLNKWKDHIEVLDLENNVGLAHATNLGVYNAKHDWVLIVNDDNVFPMKWDQRLISYKKSIKNRVVITPNQIEPRPSMFKQFVIKDFGNLDNFNYEEFIKYELDNLQYYSDNSGSTLPIFINKYDFNSVGGWDVTYPGPWVVDWDFFLKCELNGMEMKRTYSVNFYHFGSEGTRTLEKQNIELQCHSYFHYKWGDVAQHNIDTNSKMLKGVLNAK